MGVVQSIYTTNQDIDDNNNDNDNNDNLIESITENMIEVSQEDIPCYNTDQHIENIKYEYIEVDSNNNIFPNEVSPNEVSPNEVSPNEVSPNEVSPNEVSPNEVFEEPPQFEHLTLIQQINVLIDFNKLKLSPQSASIIDTIREVGFLAITDYIQKDMSKKEIISLSTELTKSMYNPNTAELAKYKRLINSYKNTNHYMLSRQEVLHYMWVRYGYLALRCNIRYYDDCEYKTKGDKLALKFLSRVYKYTSKLLNNSRHIPNPDLFLMIQDFFDLKERYFD
jgi:hypothetical protein